MNQRNYFKYVSTLILLSLCGYLPFYHEERAITVRIIRSGKFDFDDEEGGDISDEGK